MRTVYLLDWFRYPHHLPHVPDDRVRACLKSPRLPVVPVGGVLVEARRDRRGRCRRGARHAHHAAASPTAHAGGTSRRKVGSATGRGFPSLVRCLSRRDHRGRGGTPDRFDFEYEDRVQEAAVRAVAVPGPSPACSGVRPATAHAARTDTESNTMSRNAVTRSGWIRSHTTSELDAEDYPHQDEPTEEELRTLAAEMPVDPPPTDAELDARAKQQEPARCRSEPINTPGRCRAGLPQHTPRSRHHEDATTTDGGTEAKAAERRERFRDSRHRSRR